MSSDLGLITVWSPFHSTGTYWALAALQEVADEDGAEMTVEGDGDG